MIKTSKLRSKLMFTLEERDECLTHQRKENKIKQLFYLMNSIV
jgi:hypothetical protein